MTKQSLLAAALVAATGAFACAAHHEGDACCTMPAGASPAASPAAAAPPAGPPEKVASVEGIDEYRLSNGLQVLLFPDDSKQQTTVNVTYLVGSRDEQYGETGMAHLLEHLMFKGSTHHTNIPQELTTHGARPNGSTWFDRTNYFETFQSSDENLKWALDLESDRMVNSFIAKKDLDSEMTVVRNEFESGENSPGNILGERVQETQYIWHNYGHPTIGARSDIENVPIDHLQAFYREWYQPDDAVLVVAGRFDPKTTLDLINADFGRIAKPTRELPHFWTEEPTQDGERAVTLRRVGDVQLVDASYHTVAGSHPDAMAVEALAYVLGDTPSGRLYAALVKTGKAASVGGGFMTLHDPGFISFSAEVRKGGDLADVQKTFLDVIENSGTHPVTQTEVDRAKADWLKNFDLAMNDPNRVGLWISEWAALGDWRLMFLSRDRMKAVTADDVTRVAKEYLKQSNRTLGVFLPTEKPDRAVVPPTPDVVAMTKDYKGGQGIAAGETFDPTPENIQARLQNGTLPVGLKTTYLSKKNRGETVFVRLNLRFGDVSSLKNHQTDSGLAGSMLMRGTTKHTRQQIADAIDKMGARIDVDGGGQTAYATIETRREHLDEAMRLVAEILRTPAFPADEFKQLKEEELASIEQQRSEPDFLAQNEISRHMNPWPKDDVRYVMNADEMASAMNAATLAQAKSFYQSFYGASNGELAVVGDFDPAEMTKLANELFGDWKSPKPYARLEQPYEPIAPEDRKIEAPDKANARLVAWGTFKMKDTDADYPAMLLGGYMTGGGFLNSRLAVRIRQKEGLSYGVGAGFSAPSLDDDARFLGIAIFAPQNGDKVEMAFKEELARVMKSGFEADEIAEAKKGWLQGQQVARADDRGLVATLANYAFLDRPITWQSELQKKVAALTNDQILAALHAHFDPSQVSYVMAGDFAGAAKKAAAPPPAKTND